VFDVNHIFYKAQTSWVESPLYYSVSNVKSRDFAGKPVFMLMTGTSRLNEESTGKFAKLVEEKSGWFLETLFIRWGRIYWQKPPDEVNEEVREVLAVRRGM
jgi:hypothetical protein